MKEVETALDLTALNLEDVNEYTMVKLLLEMSERGGPIPLVGEMPNTEVKIPPSGRTVPLRSFDPGKDLGAGEAKAFISMLLYDAHERSGSPSESKAEQTLSEGIAQAMHEAEKPEDAEPVDTNWCRVMVVSALQAWVNAARDQGWYAPKDTPQA